MSLKHDKLNSQYDNDPCDIRRYTKWTRVTAIYPDATKGTDVALSYLALGLNGEAGEVAELIKKRLRALAVGKFGPPITYDLENELGDVIYYWARFCEELGLDPVAVWNRNRNKLMERLAQGNLAKTD